MRRPGAPPREVRRAPLSRRRPPLPRVCPPLAWGGDHRDTRARRDGTLDQERPIPTDRGISYMDVPMIEISMSRLAMGMSLHNANPGMVKGTGMNSNAGGLMRLTAPLFRPFSLTPDEGVRTPVWLAGAASRRRLLQRLPAGHPFAPGPGRRPRADRLHQDRSPPRRRAPDELRPTWAAPVGWPHHRRHGPVPLPYAPRKKLRATVDPAAPPFDVLVCGVSPHEDANMS